MRCVDCGKECGSGDNPKTYNGCCMKCFDKRQENFKKLLKTTIFTMGSEQKIYQQGWVCPKCGSVMSPTQPYCLFCCSCQNTPVSMTSVWTSDSTNIET